MGTATTETVCDGGATATVWSGGGVDGDGDGAGRGIAGARAGAAAAAAAEPASDERDCGFVGCGESYSEGVG